MIHMKTEDILKGRELKNFTREGEPSKKIYFLVSNHVVIYVGKTANIDLMIKAHSKKAFDTFSFITVPSKSADEIESFYIVKYNPIFNGMINQSTKYTKHTEIRKIVMNHITANFKKFIPKELVKYVAPGKITGYHHDTIYVDECNVEEIANSICRSIDDFLPSSVMDNSEYLRSLIQEKVNKDKRKK